MMLRCKWCEQTWDVGDSEPWCQAFVCPKRPCEADDLEVMPAPGGTLLSEMDAQYTAFERRVLVGGGHRSCTFESHARTCFEEAFRAGWTAAERWFDLEGE